VKLWGASPIASSKIVLPADSVKRNPPPNEKTGEKIIEQETPEFV
jgi:hypothetical protein